MCGEKALLCVCKCVCNRGMSPEERALSIPEVVGMCGEAGGEKAAQKGTVCVRAMSANRVCSVCDDSSKCPIERGRLRMCVV